MAPLHATAILPASQSRLSDAPNPVDRFFGLLRSAIQTCGYSHDALAASMNIDRSLLTRMLNNERPWKLEHIVALPDDVEVCFVTGWAELHGLIVVKPAQGEHAARQFVSGLFGLLMSSPLPAKANVAIKMGA